MKSQPDPELDVRVIGNLISTQSIGAYKFKSANVFASNQYNMTVSIDC